MNERICQAVGIDLGTTYSSLAYLDTQMMPRIVADSSGQTVMPSVIFFDDEEVIVGDVALSQARLRADRVVQFIKVHMGEPWRKEFGGKIHTPESLSALILGQLIRDAEPQIGAVRSAVITVPAYFTERRRRATQQAGEIAGLNVIGTLNEPISAALAYGLHRAGREERAVIYDLGGGTFDVTIVRITPTELEELATNGNRQLGGRDWDQALVDYVCDDFKKAHGVDPRESIQALQDLIIECEKAKRRVCKMAKTSVRVQAFNRDHSTEITRELFESQTAHLLQATKLTTELALEDAGLGWKDISRIVLVGGSTNMPDVRKMLKEASGVQPDSAVNPVAAVALGAAIYAHMLESGTAVKTLRNKAAEEKEPPPSRAAAKAPGPASKEPLAPMAGTPTLRFVTAHGVGVKTRTEGKWKNTVLIPKNSQVPTKTTKRFSAKGDVKTGRYITIEITQGDTPRLELAELLGAGRIELPANEQAGNPVDVTMEFDAQGRLHARALYVKTGKEMAMTIDVPGGLKQEQVADYRKFMEQSGFIRPFEMEKAVEQLSADDDDEGLPMIKPL